MRSTFVVALRTRTAVLRIADLADLRAVDTPLRVFAAVFLTAFRAFPAAFFAALRTVFSAFSASVLDFFLRSAAWARA
ncbi:MAG: hypothetical protein AMJ58_12360 [Gammaproteobacteria bacterium SG8_30]|nr:MAG: hypothetical protein AMJ58_12360 [Gammaproteobacteria bacterium SG8_30]